MGCNAWNHPPGCNCGWGGATGGGGRHSLPLNVWTSRRYCDLESYLNPNATCPVCGAAVFFYQSPYGGRVFFDELGPPWPKHPCTDSGASGSGPAVPSNRAVPAAISRTSPRAPREGWAPLVVERMVPAGEVDLLLTNKAKNTLGKVVLPVKASVLRNRPLYWCRDPADPSMITISSINAHSSELEAIEVRAPCWISTETDAKAYNSGDAPSSEDWNSIGWAASFAHRQEGHDEWASSDAVDWSWAKMAFEEGAKAGFWPSINNLAVMYREGHGVEVDAQAAFANFKLAAESLDPIPLRHLANCYRFGLGVDVDEAQSAYLEELAELQESEREEGH